MDKIPEEIVVRSWPELCERVYDFSWKDELNRFRSNYAFRGVSDAAFGLVNGFSRHCGNNPRLEYHMLRNFRKYAQLKDQYYVSSEWRVMTIAQHYGLPTRLLDWTYSPFIAIHFATAELNKYDIDGAVWQVDYVKVNRMLPDRLRQVMDEVGSNAFTIEMIEDAVPDIAEFDKLQEEAFALFYEPPSIDSRIINQYAFHSVMSPATASFDQWLLKNPGLYRKIIIPAELKWEVRDKLDQANITERILFPGLDGLARWLKRHYAPNPSTVQHLPEGST